jgi:hypothetical protein
VCDFASDSRHANAWAVDLYQRAEHEDMTTPTPFECSPAPGSTSSGTAGIMELPTTGRVSTASCNASSTPINPKRRDKPDPSPGVTQITHRLREPRIPDA